MKVRKGAFPAMKKLLSASAVCVVAVGLVVAPGVLAKKSTKNVGGTVSVNVTPSTFTTGDATVTTATASGNVASTSG
jgi:hypothetical protein